jgi:hypothetical protein
MFSFFVVLVSLSAVICTPSLKDLENYSFEKFLADFSLSYPASEIDKRRNLFNAELVRVISHNAKNLSWKEGINKFSAMFPEEKKQYYGRSKNHKAAIKKNPLKSGRPLPDDFKMKSVSELPTSVDWRTAGCLTIHQ